MSRKLKGLKEGKKLVEGKRARLDKMRDGRLRGTFKLQQLLFSRKLLPRAIFSVHPPEQGASLLRPPD
jgi:hypothetical protein